MSNSRNIEGDAERDAETVRSGGSQEMATLVDQTRFGLSVAGTEITLPGIRYSNQAEIGSGGMGQVYRVRDQNLNREVAMKVLRTSIVGDELIKRFHIEAQISGQLEHPGLLPVHELGRDEDGNAFFTMRYVPLHETLSTIIARLQMGDPETHRNFSIERRVQIIQRVADALSYAHKRGVIHRDIKPSNILIGAAGEVYLADWGVATLSGLAGTSVQTNVDQQPLEHGELSGTPLYMAPEQLLGESHVDEKSDVYGLCAVAFEFFSTYHYLGAVPPESPLAILTDVLEQPRVDAETYLVPIQGRVPRQLSRILRWGLQHDRSASIPSAEVLGKVLQDWLEGNAPVVCPGTFIQRRLIRVSRSIDRRPVLMPLVMLSIFGLLAACVVYTVLHVSGLIA